MSVNISGIEDLFRKLDRTASLDILEEPMQRGVLRLEAYMKDYPPAPAHSRYVRTGTLGRRWTTKIERSANGLTGKAGNNTEYGPFVQSKAFQRRIFQRIGWRTDSDAIQANEDAIRADFQQAIDKALGG